MDFIWILTKEGNYKKKFLRQWEKIQRGLDIR